MSNSPRATYNSDSGSSTVPRAVVHKRILEAAEARPTASLESLANDVSGASVDLVERVLDEYGDPLENDHEVSEMQEDDDRQPNSTSEESTGSDNETPERQPDDVVPMPAGLAEEQRETFRAIYENPEATQRELAELLGVSSATINRRINSIDNFDWDDRQEFVTKMFTGDDVKSNGKGPDQVTELSKQITETKRLVATLKDEVGNRSETPESEFLDPELAHKVLRACMVSDEITEEEELRILKATIAYGTYPE